MHEELAMHREKICEWFNANGYKASIYDAGICQTMCVDDTQVWHEKQRAWVSWWIDQITDHSHRNDWHFRTACEFLFDDHDWEKQAKYILQLIELQPAFERLQDGYMKRA